MSFRADVAIAYTKDGWKKMEEYFINCSQNEQGILIDLLQDADKNLVHADGSQLLFFQSIKLGTPDINIYMMGHHLLDQSDFLRIDLDENGCEYFEGDFSNNPFGLTTVHHIFMSEGDTEEVTPPYPWFVPLPEDEEITDPDIIINDTVCLTCGNDKVNSTETTCWKCGAPQ